MSGDWRHQGAAGCVEQQGRRAIMKRADIVKIEFDLQDIHKAEQWQRFMDQKNEGSKTINADPNKNKTGNLGHRALEKLLDNHSLTYHSTLYDKFERGDDYDVQVAGNCIDVKTWRRQWDERWFYNLRAAVFSHHSHKLENYFVFVSLDDDYMRAHILGAMSCAEFYDRAIHTSHKITDRDGKPLEYDYVLSRQLTPILKFIYRA